MGKSTINGPYSIAMLNYQRVLPEAQDIPHRLEAGQHLLHCAEGGPTWFEKRSAVVKKNAVET